jgi:hypothetical protein
VTAVETRGSCSTCGAEVLTGAEAADVITACTTRGAVSYVEAALLVPGGMVVRWFCSRQHLLSWLTHPTNAGQEPPRWARQRPAQPRLTVLPGGTS